MILYILLGGPGVTSVKENKLPHMLQIESGTLPPSKDIQNPNITILKYVEPNHKCLLGAQVYHRNTDPVQGERIHEYVIWTRFGYTCFRFPE